ncbi:MAG: acyl-ACP--UDP-N-acetylglucosamine O-acyltransferase [Planctomycetota bacterium]|jgi:UDP-N-acetylglucosamine acyltransferase|nr:acyl-ACP--UDP-N-acetylglucosamine O-acyltransferase [Planctomycetota bacterium]MDP7249060.1 acyl-ACP--UDP-N-acetylglucosamine O-acyltransferase [Planctomycetota bacterium]
MSVHPTAIIDPAAEIAEDVDIGPYVIVEGPVRIGAGTRILSHAHLSGDTQIGNGCEIHMGAVLGHTPQDRDLEGEGGGLTIGDRNLVREYVTIHRASKPGERTIIGDGNFLLSCCHIAHNCRIGNINNIANGALLAGYVTLGDRNFISGNVVIHQFVKVGDMTMIGGASRVSKDVPPYMILEGNSKIRGVNFIGLQRAGLSEEQRLTIKKAYRILYQSRLNVRNAVAKLEELRDAPEIQNILDFIANSERGLSGGGRAR